MDITPRQVILVISYALVNYILFNLFDEVNKLIMEPLSEIEILKGIIGIIALIIIIVLSIYFLWEIIRYITIKKIDGVQAYVFFPKGTPNENVTLNYHKKHLHKKLFVNYKTKPPKAYYLTRDSKSYGWRLINKYPSMWISELHTNSESNTFTKNWCEKKGYILIERNVSKKDLLEEE